MDLTALRSLYARQMLAKAGVEDPRVEAAFAEVPREAFLGDAPWSLVGLGMRRHRLRSNDPALVYQDVLVELDGARAVNNGSPSLHAWLLQNLAVEPGHRVVHIGAGTGYYTALLAELAGASGHVAAVEFDAGLAARARANLRDWPAAAVEQGDGVSWPREAADRIYVNFGIADLPTPWIEQLRPGGRLVFPLGAPTRGRVSERAAALLIERTEGGFAASSLGAVGFVMAEGEGGATSAEREAALARAFDRGPPDFVRGLRWRQPADPARCWFWSPEWSLTYDS